MTGRALVAGVFVGGASSRMQGLPKGLLRTAEGETVVARALRLCGAAGAQETLLIGDHPAYADLGARGVGDALAGVGPLGGLLALLRYAGDRYALALACDMPFVPASLLERLANAPEAPVVAPRRDGRWEPLCARYDPVRVLAAAEARARAGQLSLLGLLDASGADELQLAPGDAESLRDWDAPHDVTRDGGRAVP